MKKILFTSLLLMSFSPLADTITCRSTKAIQTDEPEGMVVDAEVTFDLNRETKTISKLLGHIFVQSPFYYGEDVSVLNSYMGFFSLGSVSHNPNYKPIRYKGYTQFKDFDAIHTAGLESGMWGEFVLDLTKDVASFDGRYIFQAGDHMGGTVIFTCDKRA